MIDTVINAFEAFGSVFNIITSVGSSPVGLMLTAVVACVVVNIVLELL